MNSCIRGGGWDEERGGTKKREDYVGWLANLICLAAQQSFIMKSEDEKSS